MTGEDKDMEEDTEEGNQTDFYRVEVLINERNKKREEYEFDIEKKKSEKWNVNMDAIILAGH